MRSLGFSRPRHRLRLDSYIDSTGTSHYNARNADVMGTSYVGDLLWNIFLSMPFCSRLRGNNFRRFLTFFRFSSYNFTINWMILINWPTIFAYSSVITTLLCSLLRSIVVKDAQG